MTWVVKIGTNRLDTRALSCSYFLHLGGAPSVIGVDVTVVFLAVFWFCVIALAILRKRDP